MARLAVPGRVMRIMRGLARLRTTAGGGGAVKVGAGQLHGWMQYLAGRQNTKRGCNTVSTVAESGATF